MISIIIPVYNVEKFLPECLDSILCQSYSDYEVILVDDGSPDGSGAICDSYAERDNRFRAIHQRNSGVSIARNNGIAQACGEWVTFVDSDDWLDPDFLSSFQLDDDTDLSVTGLRYMRCPERVEMKQWGFEEKTIFLGKDFESIARNNLLEYGTVCCKAYRKEILDKFNLRFDPEISFHEDHLLFLQYLKYIEIVSLHRTVGYNYRITYSGVSLSSKIHPWDKLNMSGIAMYKAVLALPSFNQFPLWYQNKISTFCTEPMLGACRFVFMSNLKGREKKKAYAAICLNRDIIRNAYYPHTMRNWLQKHCFLLGFYPLKLYYSLIKLGKHLKHC